MATQVRKLGLVAFSALLMLNNNAHCQNSRSDLDKQQSAGGVDTLNESYLEQAESPSSKDVTKSEDNFCGEALDLTSLSASSSPETMTNRPLSTDEKIDQLSKRIDEISERNVMNDWQGKNARASVYKGPFFSLDFLYWQAQEDALEYVQHDKPSLTNYRIALEDLHFDWNPGFKLGLGYIFPQRDQWDVSLSWTYLHSKAHASIATNDPTLKTDVLRPIWLSVVLGSVADRASAHWALNYNLLDLDLGRDYFIGRWLSLRPHIGLRGASIHQDYNVHYHGGFQYSDSGGTHTLFKNTSLNADNDFDGIGFRLGADTDWHISSQWSILANISGSLVYGKFKVREAYDGGKLQATGVTVFILDTPLTERQTFWRLRPCMESELGLQWHKFFHAEKYRVAASATYNFVYWPNQNELINIVTAKDNTTIDANNTNSNSDLATFHQQGNLQLQGVKVGVRFDF